MSAKLWLKLTVEEIARELEQTPTALLPLGVTEQHGYHLPLAVDVYNTEMICTRASEQTGCLVIPPLQTVGGSF